MLYPLGGPRTAMSISRWSGGRKRALGKRIRAGAIQIEGAARARAGPGNWAAHPPARASRWMRRWARNFCGARENLDMGQARRGAAPPLVSPCEMCACVRARPTRRKTLRLIRTARPAFSRHARVEMAGFARRRFLKHRNHRGRKVALDRERATQGGADGIRGAIPISPRPGGRRSGTRTLFAVRKSGEIRGRASLTSMRVIGNKRCGGQLSGCGEDRARRGCSRKKTRAKSALRSAPARRRPHADGRGR